MLKKEQLIYIYPNSSTFMEGDIAFLSKKFTVIRNTYTWYRKYLLPFFLIHQFCWLLLKMAHTKAVIVSFGGYWSLLPTLLGKLFNTPVFIILNGTDCVSFPSYHYGSLRKPILRTFIYYSYKYATELLPVSEALVETAYTYDSSCIHKKQGFRYFFPKLKTPYTVIPNGFHIDFWKNTHKKREANAFITVASISNTTAFRLKGIDMFIQMARHFKTCRFTLVGLSEEMQQKMQKMPDNLKCYPYLAPEKLREAYQKNEFYVQLSINEGFGCALSEAMLCGCIPIVSNVGILSEMIGDSGVVIDKNDAKIILETVEKIVLLTAEEKEKLRMLASKRIAENYPLRLREKQLLKIIENHS